MCTSWNMKDRDGRVLEGEGGGNIDILKFDQNIFKYEEKKETHVTAPVYTERKKTELRGQEVG